MPSRKSESGETPPSSQRSSMRRLSSIASFQALNPFNRRRSKEANSSTATSSTSNLSISSTTANAPQRHKTPASSFSFPLFSSDDDVTALPIPPVPSHTASRRSSYVCIPDDPIGRMPRSRTFSNLPLPVRAQRNPPMASSKSHSRLPSALLPSTRIPTPPISNRRHSNTRLTPAEPKPSFIKNRMKRSDTEPLLPVNLDQVSSIGRATAFKENISNSPAKPLPPMAMLDNRDLYGSSLPSRTYAIRHAWLDTTEASEPLLQDNDNFHGSLPPLHCRQPSDGKLWQSSPAYRSSRDRAATPGASIPEPMQRWNSQPVFTNVTNRRNSRHGEIKERRLLSEVKPAPAPPPKTPLTDETLTVSKAKSLNNSANHLRQVSVQSPSLAKLPAKPRALSPQRSTQEITHPEPLSYWCGRFAALNDRYRTEELAAHLHNPKSESDKMHTPEANMRRTRRALEHLYGLCATQAARESFVVFQLQFAATENVPELGRPMQVILPERRFAFRCRQEEEAVGGSERDVGVVGGGVGENRKVTFMDRLLGRGKKGLV